MSEPSRSPSTIRAGLLRALRDANSVERDVFAAVDPGTRDAPAADGGWSTKDILAHLSAWRERRVARLSALREGREERTDARETDEINAVIHAERADWSWDRVAADANASAAALVAEVEQASDATLETDRISAMIMGSGPEHALAHLRDLAAGTGLDSRLESLADTIMGIIDRGGWPARAAAYARYNLACFHALSGHLDVARELLRMALVDQEDLRALAPVDSDLIALRDELPTILDA